MKPALYHQRQILLGDLQSSLYRERFQYPDDLQKAFERGFLTGYRFTTGIRLEATPEHLTQLFEDFKRKLPFAFPSWNRIRQIEWVAECSFRAGECFQINLPLLAAA